MYKTINYVVHTICFSVTHILFPSLRASMCYMYKVIILSYAWEGHNITGISLMVTDWTILSSHDHRWATDELSLSKTGLADYQKQIQTFPGSVLLLVTPTVICPSFHRLLIGFIVPSTKNRTRPRKGLMLPGRFYLKGIVFFYPLFVSVCEQLLKGIVYPLAVKTHNLWDLVH